MRAYKARLPDSSVRAYKARLPDSSVRAYKARLPGPCCTARLAGSGNVSLGRRGLQPRFLRCARLESAPTGACIGTGGPSDMGALGKRVYRIAVCALGKRAYGAMLPRALPGAMLAKRVYRGVGKRIIG